MVPQPLHWLHTVVNQPNCSLLLHWLVKRPFFLFPPYYKKEMLAIICIDSNILASLKNGMWTKGQVQVECQNNNMTEGLKNNYGVLNKEKVNGCTFIMELTSVGKGRKILSARRSPLMIQNSWSFPTLLLIFWSTFNYCVGQPFSPQEINGLQEVHQLYQILIDAYESWELLSLEKESGLIIA